MEKEAELCAKAKNGRGMKSGKTDDEIREEMAKHGWHNEHGERADSMISRLIGV